MYRGLWWATDHRVTKRLTLLKLFSTQARRAITQVEKAGNGLAGKSAQAKALSDETTCNLPEPREFWPSSIKGNMRVSRNRAIEVAGGRLWGSAIPKSFNYAL